MKKAGNAGRRAIAAAHALLCLCLLTTFEAAQAQPGQRGLSGEDILASSATHYPRILERIAERRGAEGGLLEAQGAFDLIFAADSFSRLSGYYDGSVVSGGVKRSLPALGSSVFADYRISSGEFPLYEDINYTNDLGEIKLGVLFSLLRDRNIDDRRFGRIDAELALREAGLDLLLTQIGVQRRALIAYWRWVTAGRTLEVYENLLAIARDRQAGLEEQVRRGAQAEISLIENRQNITRRETFVTDARRNLRAAANELSLFYRSGDGLPVIPGPEQLPEAPPIGAADELVPRGRSSTQAVLANRPELQLLQTALERAEYRIALAENSLKPRVDLSFEVARDFGSVAEGGPSREGTDTIVGVSFSVPLQQRTALGRVRRETAQIEAIRQQQRLREDQIAIELENIVLNLNAADDLLQLAADQVEQTELVREAEQRRFDNGASDFFLVNVREETAANARVQYYAADLERHIARADYDAAIVDLQRLGLDRSR